MGGNPIVFDRVKGPYCWDVDGNKYIDYIGSWGPAIVGAANDEVNEALKAQMGTSFGAPSALEVRSGAGWAGCLYRSRGLLLAVGVLECLVDRLIGWLIVECERVWVC